MGFFHRYRKKIIAGVFALLAMHEAALSRQDKEKLESFFTQDEYALFSKDKDNYEDVRSGIVKWHRVIAVCNEMEECNEIATPQDLEKLRASLHKIQYELGDNSWELALERFEHSMHSRGMKKSAGKHAGKIAEACAAFDKDIAAMIAKSPLHKSAPSTHPGVPGMTSHNVCDLAQRTGFEAIAKSTHLLFENQQKHV